MPKLNNFFADTTYANQLNVTIPKFKIYRHNMHQVLANDQNNHLSLSKMADQAKQDQMLFQSLTEPLLDGQLGIKPDWHDLNAILLFITMGTTVFLFFTNVLDYS